MLLLKLTLAPVLIGLVSLAERKWGAGISGALVGLPLTFDVPRPAPAFGADVGTFLSKSSNCYHRKVCSIAASSNPWNFGPTPLPWRYNASSLQARPRTPGSPASALAIAGM
jgi:hypothetical protein